MQLSLELFEDEVTAGPLWEELAPAERLAVVSTLARLMAKSIEEKEGRHDQSHDGVRERAMLLLGHRKRHAELQ